MSGSDSENKGGLFSSILSMITGKKDVPEKKLQTDTKYEMVVISGEDEGKKFILDENPVAIGRKLSGDKRTGDILIKDSEETIAIEQARLTWSEERNIHIIHFAGGTLNPTVIDGVTIERPTYLIDGCKIVIGKNILIYQKEKTDTSEKSISRKVIEEEERFIIEDKEEEDGEEDLTTVFLKSGYEIQVISGSQKGEKFELNTPLISIGKYTGKEKKGWILLDSSFVSGDQAILRWKKRDGKFGILHTGEATNSTMVNNKEVSSRDFTILKHGDIIQIGDMELKVINKLEKTGTEISPFEPLQTGEGEVAFEERTIAIKLAKEDRVPKPQIIEEDDENYYPEETIPVLLKNSKGSEEAETEDEDEEDEEVTIIESTIGFSLQDSDTLKVISGPDEGRIFTVSRKRIEDRLFIGSKGKTRKDIELIDTGMSDSFASLTVEGEWLCINLEDKKGKLLVNDRAVIKKGLEHKDLIKMGSTIIEYNISNIQEPEKRTGHIEIIEGMDTGKKFPLDKDKIHIGRKSGSHDTEKEIELPKKDKSISRHHAIIEKRGWEFYLINEKPENITLLNGVQVTEPRPLLNNDKIQTGDDTVLLFHHIHPPFIPAEK